MDRFLEVPGDSVLLCTNKRAKSSPVSQRQMGIWFVNTLKVWTSELQRSCSWLQNQKHTGVLAVLALSWAAAFLSEVCSFVLITSKPSGPLSFWAAPSLALLCRACPQTCFQPCEQLTCMQATLISFFLWRGSEYWPFWEAAYKLLSPEPSLTG